MLPLLIWLPHWSSSSAKNRMRPDIQEGSILLGIVWGPGVSEYMLEILDREEQNVEVRQLIGLGPPNNGSSIAELFCDPVHGPG